MLQQFAILASAGLLCASCASAPGVTDSWRDPSVHDYSAGKVLVIVTSSEESFRRVAEDETVRALEDGSASPSYGMLASGDLDDAKAAAALARSKGFDSALVVRVLEVDKLQQYVPSAYSPVFLHFSDQHNSTAFYYPTRFDESYTYIEKTYRVETNLYSLAEDKLVWSGVVQVRDPDSMRELAALNAGAVLPELRRQRLLR